MVVEHDDREPYELICDWVDQAQKAYDIIKFLSITIGHPMNFYSFWPAGFLPPTVSWNGFSCTLRKSNNKLLIKNLRCSNSSSWFYVETLANECGFLFTCAFVKKPSWDHRFRKLLKKLETLAKSRMFLNCPTGCIEMCPPYFTVWRGPDLTCFSLRVLGPCIWSRKTL